MPNQQIGAPDFAARPPLTPVSRRLFNAAADDRRTAGRLARLPDRIRHVRLPAGRPGRALPGAEGVGHVLELSFQPGALIGVEHWSERQAHRVQCRLQSVARGADDLRVVLRALLQDRANRVPLRGGVRRDDILEMRHEAGWALQVADAVPTPRTRVASAKRPSENPTISVTASSAIDFIPGVIMACPPRHPTSRTTMTPSRRSPA